MISEEELAPFDEIPAVWGVLLNSVPDVRFVNGTHTAVIPAGETLELVSVSPDLRMCLTSDCLIDGAQTFSRRPGESPYLILNPAQPPPWTDDLVEIGPVRFANGAYLPGMRYVITV